MRRLTQESDSAYIRSLRRAERMLNEDGLPLIQYQQHEYQRTLGSNDDVYCHIDTPDVPDAGIAQTNIRELSDQAKYLLETLFSASRARILFLGAGAGLECIQAKDIAPNAHLETRALSPLDPFRFPLLPYHKLKAQAHALVRDTGWQKNAD